MNRLEQAIDTTLERWQTAREVAVQKALKNGSMIIGILRHADRSIHLYVAKPPWDCGLAESLLVTNAINCQVLAPNFSLLELAKLCKWVVAYQKKQGNYLKTSNRNGFIRS